MALDRVIVTLIPLSPDLLPPRTFTLSKERLCISIGRSSKRANKQRAPAEDNAWFDSRVVSRNHAELSLCVEKETVSICDCNSTHGTWVNDVKLIPGKKTPLVTGDILKFGVVIDRGDEVFPALEVRGRFDSIFTLDQMETPEPSPAQEKPAPSKNTFCVPEDDEDDDDNEGSTDAENMSPEVSADIRSDESNKSASRYGETTTLNQRDASTPLSSASSMHKLDASQVWLEEKLPATDGGGPAESCENLLSAFEDLNASLVPETQEMTSPEPPAAPTDPSVCRSDDDREKGATLSAPQFTQYPTEDLSGHFPLCNLLSGDYYRSLPIINFNDRDIDRAWCCSLQKDSYWVCDSPNFKPVNGTECVWQPRPEIGSFCELPGPNLKYWAVDKRKYWILKGDGLKRELRWWIVKKPRDLLDEGLRSELQDETPIDDCHKCWIVSVWSPQMVGNRWYEHEPYWDSEFDQKLLSRGLDEPAEVPDKGRHSSDLIDYDSDSSSSGAAPATETGNLILDYFFAGSYGVSSAEDDESSSSQTSSDEDGVLESRPASEDESQYDSESASDSILDSDVDSGPSEKDNVELEFVNPRSTEITATVQQGVQGVTGQPLGGETSSKDAVDGDKSASANFAHSRACGRMPHLGNLHDQILRAEAEREKRLGSYSAACVQYTDGPFAGGDSPRIEDPNDSTHDPTLLSSIGDTGKATLKRTASEMETEPSAPDASFNSFSQDAQRPELHVTSSSQPNLDQIAESQVAASTQPALSESEPPRKRVKPNDSSPSKTFASHAATAVVGAVLGGLGTIVLLAALPPEYFQ